MAFLTLAFALALLAEGYRSTLVQAERDQASFAVPLDIVVREDLRSLVPVLDASSLERYGSVAEGSKAVPILRVRTGTGNAEGIRGVTMLGLPAGEIPNVSGWRDDFSDRSRSELAALVRPAAPIAVQGIRLGSRLTFLAGPGVVSLVATIATPDGRYSSLDLGPLSADAPTRVDRLLPVRLRGGTLVALGLVPPRLTDRGADAGVSLAGRLRLTGLDASSWIGEGGVVPRPAPGGVELAYRISQQSDARLRAPQATDAAVPQVIVTPRLGSSPEGRVAVSCSPSAGGRFPSRSPRSSIASRARRARRWSVTSGRSARPSTRRFLVPVARTRSGSTYPTSEIGGAMATLARPPYRAVESVSRVALLDEARDDPLGHGTLLALDSAAIVALLLAALGLALTVRTDLRDDQGELYDLEAQGASPSLLRRIVRVRALVVGIAGVLAGAVAGLLLALLVTRVVAVTARAAATPLPLQTSFDLRVVGVAALVYLLVAAALVALATRRAFRSDRGPVRAQESGA